MFGVARFSTRVLALVGVKAGGNTEKWKIVLTLNEPSISRVEVGFKHENPSQLRCLPVRSKRFEMANRSGLEDYDGPGTRGDLRIVTPKDNICISGLEHFTHIQKVHNRCLDR